MERLVAVEQRLHPIIAGRHVLQASRRPAEDPLVDDDVLTGLQAVDVDAEDRPRAVGAVLIALRARLGSAVIRDEEEDAAVQRIRAARGWKGNGEAKRARRGSRARDEHSPPDDDK